MSMLDDSKLKFQLKLLGIFSVFYNEKIILEDRPGYDQDHEYITRMRQVYKKMNQIIQKHIVELEEGAIS